MGINGTIKLPDKRTIQDRTYQFTGRRYRVPVSLGFQRGLVGTPVFLNGDHQSTSSGHIIISFSVHRRRDDGNQRFRKYVCS